MKMGKLLGAFDVTSIALRYPERGRIPEREAMRPGSGRPMLPRSLRSMPRLRPVLEGELFDP
jgi:hypothetical protein